MTLLIDNGGISFSKLLLVHSGNIHKYPFFIAKARARLLEPERNMRRPALLIQLNDPLEVADPGIITRFAANNYIPYAGEVGADIHLFQNRLNNDLLALYGQRGKMRQAFVSHGLIFSCAGYGDIFIAATPIRRYAVQKAVDPLGGNVKMQIRTGTDRFPRLLPILIRIFKKKIRSETGIDVFAVRQEFEGTFMLSAFDFFQGQQIGGSQGKMRRITSELSIHPVYIAMLTAWAELFASMPRIPLSQFRPFLSRCSLFQGLSPVAGIVPLSHGGIKGIHTIMNYFSSIIVHYLHLQLYGTYEIKVAVSEKLLNKKLIQIMNFDDCSSWVFFLYKIKLTANRLN